MHRVSAWCKRDQNEAFSMKDCCGGECPCPSPSLQPVPQSQVFGTAEFKEHYPVGRQGRQGKKGKRDKRGRRKGKRDGRDRR